MDLEYVSNSLNQFRNNLIEKYGSSKVPTPVIRDVYKQCAGGLSSVQKSSDLVKNAEQINMENAVQEKEIENQERNSSQFLVN